MPSLPNSGRKPQCTWEGCRHSAIRPQVDKDGETWAVLCIFHERELNDAIRRGDVPRMTRNWVLAHGGYKRARKCLAKEISATADVLSAVLGFSSSPKVQ